MIHSFSQTSDVANTTAGQQSIGLRSDMQATHPLIQLFNADSADNKLAASIASELTNISGAEVIVYARTESEAYDQVYEEDPDPTYKSGKHLKAYFVPQPLAVQLTPFGADAPNQTTVVFDRGQVYTAFGSRMIRIGDIIALPYNASGLKPDRYRVLNAFDSGNFKYNWLYWSCVVETLTDDVIIDIDHK